MKRVIWVLLCVAMLLNSSVTVYATEFEKKFNIDKELSKCMFQIYWDNKSALGEVELTSPEGKVYDEKHPTYGSMEGLVWITLDVAVAGEWKVKVKGENLGKIEIQTGTQPKYIRITEFKASQTEANKFKITWDVSHINGSARFAVYASKENKGYGGTKIAEFVDGASGSRVISAENIDAGQYYLCMEAIDDLEVPDIKYTEKPYKIVSLSAPTKLKNISYGMIDRDVYAKWPLVTGITEYKFMIFKENEHIPFFETITEDNWFSYPVEEELKNQNIEFAVAAVKNGVMGDYERFSFKSKVDLKYKVDLKASGNINSKSLKVGTEFEKPIKMSVYINDEAYVEDSNKSGNYNVNLLDGENKVGIVFKDDKGNIKTEERNYYVDTYAPQLTIDTDLDGKRVSTSTVVVSGKTEPASTLSVNGQATTVDKEGNYSTEVKLSPGENSIEIKAKDVSGNESVILLTVTCDVIGNIIFYAGIGLFIFLTLSGYYGVIFIKAIRRDKKANEETD